MFRIFSSLAILAGLPAISPAQPTIGKLPAPSTPVVVNPTPYPFLPATVARQSALPLTSPAVSPILQRPQQFNNLGGFGGGYVWFPTYWLDNRPVIQVNYNYNIQLLPPPMFVVPGQPSRARLSLDVPGDVDVWLQGKRLEPFVGKRTFESPDLQPGETHTFSLRIIWSPGISAIEESQNIELRAGEHRSVLYLAAPTKPTKPNP